MLRTVSAGLLGDMDRCGDGRCELCDEGVVEDTVHFLLQCGEFKKLGHMPIDMALCDSMMCMAWRLQ